MTKLSDIIKIIDGTSYIRDTHITVIEVLDLLAVGTPIHSIYPNLTEEDINVVRGLTIPTGRVNMTPR